MENVKAPSGEVPPEPLNPHSKLVSIIEIEQAKLLPAGIDYHDPGTFMASTEGWDVQIRVNHPLYHTIAGMYREGAKFSFTYSPQDERWKPFLLGTNLTQLDELVQLAKKVESWEYAPEDLT